MAYPPKRPVGIALLAILVILAGFIFTILAVLAVLGGIAVLALTGVASLLVFALLFLILSVITLAAGFGLWNLRPWAWWLAVLVVLLQIARALVAALSEENGTPYISFVISFFLFVYLLLVRDHFRRQPAYAYPPP